MKVYRELLARPKFWGLARVGKWEWRICFGFGFLELGTSTSGLWLPKTYTRKEEK